MKSPFSLKHIHWKSAENLLFCLLTLLVILSPFHLPEVDIRQMLFPDEKSTAAAFINFPDAYSRQFNSAYRFRERFIRAYNRFKIQVLKETVFPNVVIGNDRWLFWTGENNSNDFQNVQPFSETELAAIQKNLDDIYETLSAQGIVFRVVVAPNKATIYPDKMPSYIPKIGKKSRLDQVLAYMREHGKTMIVDPRPALLTARQSFPVYHAFDTHWNQDGALIASNEIVRSLQPEIGALPLAARSDFDIHYEITASDLPSRISAEDLFIEEAPILTPRFARQTRSLPVDGAGQTLVVQDDNALPTLLFFQDSFGNALIPFLSDSFRRSLFIKSSAPDLGLIMREKPNVVIFEMAERYLGERLLTDIAP